MNLPNFITHINNWQIMQILFVLNTMNHYGILTELKKRRPMKRVRDDPVAWWR